MAWSIPQRFFRITLYAGRANEKRNNVLAWLNADCKVSFQTSETVSGAVNETNVEIGGLTTEHMGYLSTSFSQWQANPIRNQIVIEAGYDTQHSVIFDGEIIDAQPNLTGADYVISLKCLSFYEKMIDNPISLSFEGEQSVETIARAIASELGFGFVNGLEKDIMIANYSYSNMSPIQHCRNLSAMSGVDCWISHNIVYIKERGKALRTLPVLKITSDDIIGSPVPTPVGCNVSIRLNPAVASGQKVRLLSKRFPLLNSANYVIQLFSHSGETRGAKWQTNLTLLREEVYNV